LNKEQRQAIEVKSVENKRQSFNNCLYFVNTKQALIDGSSQPSEAIKKLLNDKAGDATSLQVNIVSLVFV
jgi:hypothetical protein